jgi:uncharacterized protein (DUF433 family)
LREYDVSEAHASPWRRSFEHLDQGSTVDEFLEWFPSVSREQVHEVLAFAKSSLEQPAAVA